MTSPIEDDIYILECIRDRKPVQFRERYTGNPWTDRAKGMYIGISTSLYEYRVKPEPKTIYVNEYPGYTCSYSREDLAKSFAGADAIRVAVPYREIIEESDT